MIERQGMGLVRLPVILGLASLTLAATFFARVNCVSTEIRMFRAIVSLDRQSGRVHWMLRGLEGLQPPTDGRNSPATPTPVTDGAIICAYFGNPGLMCADAMGQLAWSRTDIAYERFYGAAFSLVLSDGLLVIANDRADGQAVIHALDAKTAPPAGPARFRPSRRSPATVARRSCQTSRVKGAHHVG